MANDSIGGLLLAGLGGLVVGLLASGGEKKPKKEVIVMSDKKDAMPIPTMPMMELPPQMMNLMVPPAIPNIPYNSGWIKRWRHKGKVRDLAEINTLQAQMIETSSRASQAMMDTMHGFATFGQRLEMSFVQHRHEIKMMETKELRAQLENNQLMLTNQLTQVQVQQAQAELEMTLLQNEIAKKEMKGTIDDTEDKTGTE